MTDYKPGTRIQYRLSDNRWLPGVVVHIVGRHVTIRLDGFRMTRNTVVEQIRREIR